MFCYFKNAGFFFFYIPRKKERVVGVWVFLFSVVFFF